MAKKIDSNITANKNNVVFTLSCLSFYGQLFAQLNVVPLSRPTAFTARCTIVQSVVLRSHVVRLSVCPSVTLVDCDHRLEILETNCTDNYPNTFLFVAQRPSIYSRGNMGKFGETKNLTKKTLLSLTLVRLCEET